MNDLMVPTKKITLPTTKYIVEIRENLGTSAVRKIQRILFNGGIEVSADQKPEDAPKKLDGKQMANWYDMQEEALRLACVAIFKQDENQQVTQLTFADPNDIIGEVPMEDGSVVYEEISNLINRSMMTTNAKKN